MGQQSWLEILNRSSAEKWTQDYKELPLSASFWKVYRNEPFDFYFCLAFWEKNIDIMYLPGLAH